ncbi:MAG: hypothetical protein MAG451_02831 [Anaerolineales bacterium]|nr:hypothetical protein [Anaerolineales bacterium]
MKPALMASDTRWEVRSNWTFLKSLMLPRLPYARCSKCAALLWRHATLLAKTVAWLLKPATKRLKHAERLRRRDVKSFKAVATIPPLQSQRNVMSDQPIRPQTVH